MPQHEQVPNEPETQTFQRTRRGIATGAVVGAVVGALVGAVLGGLISGWGTTEMWAWILFGVIGLTIFGWFIGGMSSLEDPRRGNEPLPDEDVRGDTDLPSDTPHRRTGLPPQSSP